MEKKNKFKEWYNKYKKPVAGITVLLFFLFLFGVKLFAMPYTDDNLPGNYYNYTYDNIQTPYTLIVPNGDDGRFDSFSSNNFLIPNSNYSNDVPHYSPTIGLGRLYTLLDTDYTNNEFTLSNDVSYSYDRSIVSYGGFDVDSYSIVYDDFYTSYATLPYMLSNVVPRGVDFCDVRVSCTVYYQTVQGDDEVVVSTPVSFIEEDYYIRDMGSLLMSRIRTTINDISGGQVHQDIYITKLVIYYSNIEVFGASNNPLDWKPSNWISIDEDIQDGGRGEAGTLTGYGVRFPNSISGLYTGHGTFVGAYYMTSSSGVRSSLNSITTGTSGSNVSYILYNSSYVYNNNVWSNQNSRYIVFSANTFVNSDNQDVLKNAIIHNGAEFGYYKGVGNATILEFDNRYRPYGESYDTTDMMMSNLLSITRVNLFADFTATIINTIEGVLEFNLGYFTLGDILFFVIGVGLFSWFLKVILGG